MKTNTTNCVKISEDLNWMFAPDEDSRKRREDFVNDFFGITELEKKYGIDLDSVTTTKEETK